MIIYNVALVFEGDARRPYPTDIEMRRGCLSGISDLSFKAASSTSADLQSNKPQTYLGQLETNNFS